MFPPKLLTYMTICILFGALPLDAQNAAIKKPKPSLRECSLGRTNSDCIIVVDRDNPVSPTAVQLYSGVTLTLVVKHPKSFERYFLDYQSGQATLNPDSASMIVPGLFPSMAKLGQFKAQNQKLLESLQDVQLAPKPCNDPLAQFPDPKTATREIYGFAQLCFKTLADEAMGVYRSLEPVLAPDSLTPSGSNPNPDVQAISKSISTFLDTERKLSSLLTGLTANPPLEKSAVNEVADLSARTKMFDAVATDLQGFQQRISDLPDATLLGITSCKPFLNEDGDCVVITSRKDDPKIYQNMVTRTITYSLNSYNLMAYSQQATVDASKKKLVATIAINFADVPSRGLGNPVSAYRWEASAGAFFSTLPITSFSVAPVFSGTAISDKVIVKSALFPTVVPFAAANYRFTNEMGRRWRSAFYFTGAVGINPNTTSADFAGGLSYSWRALMISALCHAGHDVRLTQGLSEGQSLGASFSGTIPTETYWRPNFALGVSVRVPALTGR